MDQINQIRLKEKENNRSLEDDVSLPLGDKFVTKFDCYSEKVNTRVVVFERTPEEDFSCFLKKDGEYVQPSEDNVLQRGKCLVEIIKTIAAYHDKSCVAPFVQANNFTIKVQSEFVDGEMKEKTIAEFKDNKTAYDLTNYTGAVSNDLGNEYQMPKNGLYNYWENIYAFGGLVREALVMEQNDATKIYNPDIEKFPDIYSKEQVIFLEKFIMDLSMTTPAESRITSKQAAALMQVFVDSLERKDKDIPNYWVAKESVKKQYPSMIPNEIKNMILSSDTDTRSKGFKAYRFLENNVDSIFANDPDVSAFFALEGAEFYVKSRKNDEKIIKNPQDYKNKQIDGAKKRQEQRKDITFDALLEIRKSSGFLDLSKKMYIVGTTPQDGQKIPVSEDVFKYVKDLVKVQQELIKDPKNLPSEFAQKKTFDRGVEAFENGKWREFIKDADGGVAQNPYFQNTAPGFLFQFFKLYEDFKKDIQLPMPKSFSEQVNRFKTLEERMIISLKDPYFYYPNLLKLKELIYVEGKEKPEGKKYLVPGDLYNAMMQVFDKMNI